MRRDPEAMEDYRSALKAAGISDVDTMSEEVVCENVNRLIARANELNVSLDGDEPDA